MPLGRRARMGLGIVGLSGLLAAGGLARFMAPSDKAETGVGSDTASTEAASESSSAKRSSGEGFTGRAAQLAEGNPQALVEAGAEISPATTDSGENPAPLQAMSDDELDTWLADLAGLARVSPDLVRWTALASSLRLGLRWIVWPLSPHLPDGSRRCLLRLSC